MRNSLKVILESKNQTPTLGQLGGDLILKEDAVCETGLASCEPMNL